MNEKEIEGMLDKLKTEIRINEEHKAALRQELGSQKPNKNSYKKYIAAACIALMVFTTVLMLIFAPLNKVAAEPLRVQNYRTYLELESNTDLSVSEYNGVLYFNNANEGIYVYDGKEKTKIYSGNVNIVKVSPDGKMLAFYEDGSIKVMDLATKVSNIVMKSDSKVVYELSSWFDKDNILFTKYTLQDPSSSNNDTNFEEILKFNVKTLEQRKLAQGREASYITQKNKLLYQKGENIVMLDLNSNKETIIDRGINPAASPDGDSIVYTKIDLFYEIISDKVKIEKVLQNIWIASGRDFSSKTMITSNIVLEDINKEEWLKNLIPSDELQMLSFSGRYSYLNPTWSSDSNSIFAIRRDYTNNMTVAIKIDLENESLSAKTVVERYLQSVMLKDEDYQSSLIAVESKTLNNLKAENIIDYKIISEGKEEKTAYVDTILIIWNEKKGSDESLNYRFYLSNETGDYYIVDLK